MTVPTRTEGTATAAAAGHVDSALARVRAVAAARGVDGVVLTTPGAVAWATAGINAPIDRTASTDVVWLAVGPDRACVVTTNVEEPRLAAEYALHGLGLELRAAPWWDADAQVAAASAALGVPVERLGSDGHPGLGVDLSHDLVEARLDLDAWEREQLRRLGGAAAAAVEEALRGWVPGEPDRAVAARVAAGVERVGASAPVLLVGGDDRLRRFRHPVPVGEPVREVVMAVLVAARDGQHVALTRYAATPAAAQALEPGLAAVRRVHRRVLAASQPGATVGDAMRALADGYADEGAPQAWREHYQGGPIGYAQREFEITPEQVGSPWWTTVLPPGGAVAWNPSLPGGAKDEDTYLLTDGEPQLVTRTPDWPTADDEALPRPAVLLHP